MPSPMNYKYWLLSITTATYFTCIWFLSSRTLQWTTSLTFILKALPHTSHLYGFSPVWTLQWTTSLAFTLKALPQISHTFKWLLSGMNSPMNYKFWLLSIAMATYFTCIWFLSSRTLRWTTSLTFTLKALPHTSHLYGFSPVWTLQWTTSLSFTLKALPHTSHLYGFSPVWTL